jgi:hypothetical protein
MATETLRGAEVGSSAHAAPRFEGAASTEAKKDEAQLDAYRDVGYADPNVITGQDFWTDIKNTLHKAIKRLSLK